MGAVWIWRMRWGPSVIGAGSSGEEDFFSGLVKVEGWSWEKLWASEGSS